MVPMGLLYRIRCDRDFRPTTASGRTRAGELFRASPTARAPPGSGPRERLDARRRLLRVRYPDDVRGPDDLDRPPGLRSFGHDPRSTGRDVAVELAEEEPARRRAPPRPLIGGLGQRRLRHRALRDG